MKTEFTKADFKNQEIIIGLDVHMKTWHLTILVGMVLESKSFVPDPEKLAEYLHKNYPNGSYIAAYEAGCFGFWIKEELEKRGIRTMIINPADIPTTDKDKRTKTDKSDSRKIALAIRSGLIREIYAPEKEMQEMRTLSRRRYDCAKKITRIKNQIKALLKFYGTECIGDCYTTGINWTKRYIDWLSAIEFQTNDGKAAMESCLRELSFYNEEQIILLKKLKEAITKSNIDIYYNILRGVPGIGAITAITFLTEIGDIHRFSSKDKFISYLGLSPTEHSSGDSRKIGHMTKRCNTILRQMLIESSWVAIKKDPALMNYYNATYIKIGKAKAIIKVAKKLAARIRYLLINKGEYIKGVAA